MGSLVGIEGCAAGFAQVLATELYHSFVDFDHGDHARLLLEQLPEQRSVAGAQHQHVLVRVVDAAALHQRLRVDQVAISQI